MDAFRNFLYGVVALQSNLIDPSDVSEVIEAVSSFDARIDTSVGDMFVKRGWLQPKDKTLLDQLVERKLTKHERSGSSLTAAKRDLERSLTFLKAAEGCHSPRASSPGKATAEPAQQPHQRYVRSQLHAIGGIGRVWLAHDQQLDRDVAIKELLPEQCHDAIIQARFLREARITGQLEHPGIIPVYEIAYGRESQEPFYAMRFVKGRTLKEAAQAYHATRQAGAADPMELLTLLNAFVVVCKTIAYAHSRGVIHRDLKGQNVILGDFGEVVVLDWGLAKELRREATDHMSKAVRIAESGDLELTLDGEAVGTPNYMPPEQAAGRSDLINERSDVYGLGAMLYYILTGHPPFTGTTEEILQKVQSEDPTPPDQYWPEVPPTLDAACRRAMAKQPSQRFCSAIELAQEVEQWQEVQRKHAEDALRVSQALYHSLVESIPLCVWRKDREGRFTFANGAFSEAFGIKPEEMIGKTDTDYFPPDLVERIRRDDDFVMATGETLRATEERPSWARGPRLVEVIKIPVRDSAGEIVGTQGIFWDMSAWGATDDDNSSSPYHPLTRSAHSHFSVRSTDPSPASASIPEAGGNGTVR